MGLSYSIYMNKILYNYLKNNDILYFDGNITPISYEMTDYILYN